MILRLLILMILVYPQQSDSKQTQLPSYCSKPLTLAYYGDWYPYMFAVGDHYQGSDWLLLTKILQQLGCQIRVARVPERRAHTSLIKRHSLVMIGATKTKQRSEYAYFSQPYREEVMSVFYLATNQLPLTDLIKKAQLIAINEAAWYGQTIESYRAGNFRSKFVHIPNISNRISMLSKSRVQLMVEDHISGCNYFHQQAPNHASQLRFIKVNQDKVAYMFSRVLVSEEFIQLFDQKLAQLIATGVYEKLLSQYLPIKCL